MVTRGVPRVPPHRARCHHLPHPRRAGEPTQGGPPDAGRRLVDRLEPRWQHLATAIGSVASGKPSLQIWDQQGKPLLDQPHPFSEYSSRLLLAWSPVGQTLAVAGDRDHPVQLWSGSG